MASRSRRKTKKLPAISGGELRRRLEWLSAFWRQHDRQPNAEELAHGNATGWKLQ